MQLVKKGDRGYNGGGENRILISKAVFNGGRYNGYNSRQERRDDHSCVSYAAYIYIYILQSFIIILTLFSKIEIIPHDGSSYSILVFLSKFRESFYSTNIAALLIFAMFVFLLRETEQRRLKKDWRIVMLSGVFAVVYVFSLSTRELGSLAFITANGYQYIFSGMCIVGYWIMFDLMLRWTLYFAERAVPECPSAANEPRLWAILFAAILVFRLPWIFASYPATFCPDSLWQLSQGLGYTEVTLHHPPLSTAIMALCVNVGAIFKSQTFGCFLYVILQTLGSAAVFAYVLVVLRRMGIGKKAITAAFLFYTVFPIWSVYCQWFEKDLLYTEVYTLAVVMLIEVMRTEKLSKKKTAALIAVVISASLLRNNGLYELLPFLLLLALFIPRKNRKRMLCVFLSSVIVTTSVTSVLYPALGFKKGSVAEMLSIPFQQTARYVVCAGDEVTDHEREVIDSVLSYDTLESDYLYFLSDPVKAKYHGDSQALKEYFKVWFSMGKKHPSIYLEALVGISFGYIAPVAPQTEPPIPCEKEAVLEIGVSDITRRTSVIPTALLDVLWSNVGTVPIIRLLVTPGLYSWIMLTCALFLWIKKKYYAMLPTLPLIINILICAASPMSNGPRYDLTAIALTPLIIWWTAIHVSSQVSA